MPEEEGDAILRYLFEHAEKPDFQIRFRWQKDSVAFWDNRAVQHLAIWDYFPAHTQWLARHHQGRKARGMTATRRTVLGGAASAAFVRSAMAQESRELRIAVQFGITYLPLTVAREQKLIEREARAAGLAEPNVSWLQLSGGAATNDALLSGNLDIATAGIPPVVLLWARSRSNLKVHAFAAWSRRRSG